MQPQQPASSEAPFPYGWRYVRRALPSGEEQLDQVPLTLEDVLHPQEGDVIPEKPIHVIDRGYLREVFSTRPLGPRHTAVTSDLLIDWGVEGLGNHSPDVAVFVGLKRPLDLMEGVLHLRDEGGRCLLVVEVVSPGTRENDVVHKIEHYHRAGVPLYVIVDQEREGKPRLLRIFRAEPQGYQEVAPDPRGRVHLPMLGLHLSLQGDQRVICHDAKTGRELGDYDRITRELEEADRRIHEQEQAIEQAIEQGRRSDRERRQAIQAREEAERRAQDAELLAQQQTSAREEAERLVGQESRARQEAEQKARDAQQLAEQNRKAREDTELRIRQLEEALRQLQSGPTS